MSLTVKAFLLQEGAESEIRRFSVDQDVSTNYSYLTNKVTAIFPGLVNQSFETLWKDPENDFIAFSSDDELTEALGFVNDGVFRLYIKKSDRARKDTSDSDGGVPHPGVVCDGCEQPICGIRYKCFVCPDYDLCSKCDASGVHREHEMMRICSPRPGFNGSMNFSFFPPPPFGGPHHGHPHGHHHHGPPHHGHPHHGPPPPPPPHMEDDGVHPPPPPPPPGPFGPGPHGGFGPQGGFGHFGGFGPHGGFGPGRDFWRWMKNMSGANGSDTKAKKKGDKTAEDKTQKMESDSSDEGEASPTGDYLKDVGARVAAMLDPLGIDVEVDVEHNGQRRRCGGQGRGNSGPRCWGRGTWGSGYSGYSDRSASAEPAPTAGAPKTTTGDQPETQKTEVPATKLTPSAAVAKDKETEMEVASNAETGEEAMPETAAATEGAAAGPKPTPAAKPAGAPATDGAKPPRDSASPDCDWTIIHGSGANADTPPSGGRLYPQVAPPASSNPRVVQAVEDMAAMGFGDEGGWLTRLLEVSGGDINKALDAIRANRQQKN